jgi:hypothetical protein
VVICHLGVAKQPALNAQSTRDGFVVDSRTIPNDMEHTCGYRVHRHGD